MLHYVFTHFVSILNEKCLFGGACVGCMIMGQILLTSLL